MKRNKLQKALAWMLFFQVLVVLIGVLPLELNDTAKLNVIITINCGLIGGTIGNIITLRKIM